jgi:RNA polymerase sigma factor (sigma-70 family)
VQELLWPHQTNGVFATTRWTVVKGCSDADDARAREALAELCQAYWQPVYACIRHYGNSSHDAEDLTQEFFLRLLNGKRLEHLDQAKGRFRAYLLVTLQNFLRDRWRRRWTWRRGRGTKVIPFDAQEGENLYAQLPALNDTPQSLYERQWALTVIENALRQLKIELAAAQMGTLFEHFDAILSATTTQFPYQATARALNLTPGALHGALYRWRRRFQALMREEIARTVLTTAEVEDELRHLLTCVSRR